MWENMVEPDRPHDNIIWRMRFACWITEATDTHSEYVILLFFGSNGYANAPECYVLRTLPALFLLFVAMAVHDGKTAFFHQKVYQISNFYDYLTIDCKLCSPRWNRICVSQVKIHKHLRY
jgi:hypothetical protein